MELMVGTLLSSILLIGFTLLGSGIWGQLSYEDVHEKVQRYGNYVLDDISESFQKNNIDINLNSYVDNYSVVRVEFTDSNASDIKYSIAYMPSDPIHQNVQKYQVHKNNQPIHKNNDTVNQYYNEFENKGYAVSISEFKCEPSLQGAVYVINLEIEIYKRAGDSMERYNIIDFERTLFVTDDFI